MLSKEFGHQNRRHGVRKIRGKDRSHGALRNRRRIERLLRLLVQRLWLLVLRRKLLVLRLQLLLVGWLRLLVQWLRLLVERLRLLVLRRKLLLVGWLRRGAHRQRRHSERGRSLVLSACRTARNHECVLLIRILLCLLHARRRVQSLLLGIHRRRVRKRRVRSSRATLALLQRLLWRSLILLRVATVIISTCRHLRLLH